MSRVIPLATHGRLLMPWANKVGPDVVAMLEAATADGVANHRSMQAVVSGFVRRVRGIEPPCEAMVKAKRRVALESLL